MEQSLENYDSNIEDVNMEILLKKTNNVLRSKQCNQCDYASFHAGNLRKHLKTHSGERSNKCNQCDYASYEACDLRKHFLTHSGKSQTNAISATMHALIQAL